MQVKGLFFKMLFDGLKQDKVLFNRYLIALNLVFVNFSYMLILFVFLYFLQQGIKVFGFVIGQVG